MRKIGKLKVTFVFSLFLILLPLATAFDLDVNCPSSVTVGSQITCTIDLDQDITDVFGDQFVINAPGFTEGTPFLEADTNGVGAYNSNGLGALTILLKMSAGQSTGSVGTINLVAGNTAGDYTISLSDYVNADNSNSAMVTITSATVTTTTTTTTGGGGGGGSGGGGSGTTTTPTTTTTPSTTTPTTPTPITTPPTTTTPTGEPEVVDDAAPSDKGFPWLLVIGIVVLVLLVGGLTLYFLKKKKTTNLGNYPNQ